MPVSGSIARLAGGDPVPFSMIDYGQVRVGAEYVYRSVFHIDGEPFISDCPVPLPHAEPLSAQDRLQHDKATLAAAGYDFHRMKIDEAVAH